MANDHLVPTMAALEALYGEPHGPSLIKGVERVDESYRPLIPARPVLIIAVERVFYQCTKAIVRARLWDPATQVERKSLPSAGTILAEITDGRLGGPEHHR